MVMTPKRRFALDYAPIVTDHLRAIEPKYYALIRKTIEDQLQFEPDVQTRNRKPLKRPVDFGAQWELRLGSENVFRVFYKIDHENLKVNILAIGEKRGARLIIGGEEVRL
jgi:mRNA-degrading endonuclease RelE of RelBE toxin-antitoxin system